jgi:hypothetical protein
MVAAGEAVRRKGVAYAKAKRAGGCFGALLARSIDCIEYCLFAERKEYKINMAQQNNAAAAKNMPEGLQNTLNFMIQGLGAMNTGVRATYMKLEEIERLLKGRKP